MNTYQEAVERVTITGKMEDRQKARAYCSEKGLRILFDTPQFSVTEGMNLERFKIIAEKANQSN